jgi:MarR family transcriptional regulator for hemolysin
MVHLYIINLLTNMLESNDLNTLSIEFVAKLFMARTRFRLAMDDRFKPLGVTDAAWRTLFYLEQIGDGVLQKDLARVMGIESAGLVRLLDNLESKALVERRPALQDRRGKTIHLTSHAGTLLLELHGTAAQVRQSLLADVSPADLQTCLTVFNKVLTAVEPT